MIIKTFNTTITDGEFITKCSQLIDEVHEEKHQAIARLRIINDRIDELLEKIKQRTKM